MKTYKAITPTHAEKPTSTVHVAKRKPLKKGTKTDIKVETKPREQTQRRGVTLRPGEPLEQKLRRMTAQGEPIPNEIGIVTAEVEGKNYDIRSDKFEPIMEAKGKIVQLGIDVKNKEAEAKTSKKEAGEGKAGGENTV